MTNAELAAIDRVSFVACGTRITAAGDGVRLPEEMAQTRGGIDG